jgi:DNA-directed RNA polymerase subunit M/transcription elongation factor TFIIS
VPISCQCPSCGKRLKAPDSAAGKKAKCPQCGSSVPIPAEKVYEAEEVSGDEVSAGEAEDEYGVQSPGEVEGAASPVEPDRRPCPACGEMIARAAVKCRYCGEILDPRHKAQKIRKRGASAEDEEMQPIDWLLCLACSGIGCIVSIVYLTQNKPKATKMLITSICMIVFWNVLLCALGGILEQLDKAG